MQGALMPSSLHGETLPTTFLQGIFSEEHKSGMFRLGNFPRGRLACDDCKFPRICPFT